MYEGVCVGGTLGARRSVASGRLHSGARFLHQLPGHMQFLSLSVYGHAESHRQDTGTDKYTDRDTDTTSDKHTDSDTETSVQESERARACARAREREGAREGGRERQQRTCTIVITHIHIFALTHPLTHSCSMSHTRHTHLRIHALSHPYQVEAALTVRTPVFSASVGCATCVHISICA
jgi:hypothetical protein